jgi:chromosome segregation ATPase
LKGFASQFSSLEADKVRLQEEVESTSSKLDNAVKMAAAARQNADSLKKELDQLKKKLKEEEKERVEAEAQRKEKEGLLRQSILALLGNFQCLILEPFFLNFIMF